MSEVDATIQTLFVSFVLCSFVDTLRAVIIDVRWFLMLLLITLFGFAGESASAYGLSHSIVNKP
jgi:hypothetical protein